MGDPRAPRGAERRRPRTRDEGRRPAAVDQGHDGEADAGRPREARSDPAGRGDQAGRDPDRRGREAVGDPEGRGPEAGGHPGSAGRVRGDRHRVPGDPQRRPRPEAPRVPVPPDAPADRAGRGQQDVDHPERAHAGARKVGKRASGEGCRHDVKSSSSARLRPMKGSVRPKRIFNVVAVAVALAVSGLVVRHFLRSGWPIHDANLSLVGLAAVIFLAAYGFKAWGWQRLFTAQQRPAVLTLAAAGGAASVGGIALPGRCDEVIRVAVVRRCHRGRASFGAVALSLFLLGLLDSAALTPLAAVAAAVGTVGGLMEVGLIVVAVAGVGAAAVVLALPRLARLSWVSRFRVAGWVRDNATPPREAAWASLAVATSWVLRTLAIFVLLAALGLGTNFALALAFVCASAASAVLPVAPAGAAMQAGAGAAILVASGVRTEEAVAFGIAAQALVISAGAAFVVALAAWHAQGRLAGARLRISR